MCYILIISTKSIQINIVIGSNPPNPYLKSYFINQSDLKNIGGGFCNFTPFSPPKKIGKVIKNHLLYRK